MLRSHSSVLWGLYLLEETGQNLSGPDLDSRKARRALRWCFRIGSRWLRSMCISVHCHDAASNWRRFLASLYRPLPLIFTVLPCRNNPSPHLQPSLQKGYSTTLNHDMNRTESHRELTLGECWRSILLPSNPTAACALRRTIVLEKNRSNYFVVCFTCMLYPPVDLYENLYSYCNSGV